METTRVYLVEFYSAGSWWRNEKRHKTITSAEKFKKAALKDDSITKARIVAAETKMWVVRSDKGG